MSFVEKLDIIEKVSELRLKGYKPAEIARSLNISPAQTRHYINQYETFLQKRVNEDPDYLNRVAEHTFEALERLDNLIKEAWETYDTCRNNDMITQQINLIKVAGGLEAQRANLLQLMGGKMDSGMSSRVIRAEQVNEIVSNIIREVIADCDVCRLEAQPLLAEAFAKMDRQGEAAEMTPVEDEEDIVDAEVIEDEEVETTEMMADVVSY